MKRECKDCLHYGMSDDGDWYCRKHREHVQFINGCDDFWPKDHNPRCDECRFFVETVGGDLNEGRCMHPSILQPRPTDANRKALFSKNLSRRQLSSTRRGPSYKD